MEFVSKSALIGKIFMIKSFCEYEVNLILIIKSSTNPIIKRYMILNLHYHILYFMTGFSNFYECGGAFRETRTA